MMACKEGAGFHSAEGSAYAFSLKSLHKKRYLVEGAGISMFSDALSEFSYHLVKSN